MGSDPKTPTASKMITGKHSSKKLPSLKFSTTFPTLIPEEKASTISWNDHVVAKKGSNIVSGAENALSLCAWTIQHDLWIS